MKKFNYLLIACALTICAAESKASPIYVGIEGGISHANKFDSDYQNKRAKDSFIYGAKVGYQFNEYFRSDFSLMQIAKHKFSGVPATGTYVKQNLSSTLAMINAYYDLHFAKVSLFTPYLTAGAGIARNKAGNLITSGIGAHVVNGKTKNQFAWSIGAGINAEVTKNIGIDLSYHYFDLGKFSSSNVVSGLALPTVTPTITKFKTNVFTLGLRVNF